GGGALERAAGGPPGRVVGGHVAAAGRSSGPPGTRRAPSLRPGRGGPGRGATGRVDGPPPRPRGGRLTVLYWPGAAAGPGAARCSDAPTDAEFRRWPAVPRSP